MQKRLTILILTLLIGAYWLIQRAPETVSAVGHAAPLVVIDPGHGGWDPGAIRGAVYEKSLTLAVALKLGTLLQQRGYRVYYTRSTDTALSSTVLKDLTQRATLANQLGAALFISVHVNTEPTGTMAGPIVYYTRASLPSYRLATLMTQSLAATSRPHPPRPIRQWVLEVSQMPAVNVEIGFLSHSVDAQRMQSTWYQAVLAQSMANGVSRYLGQS
ncbi:MAG: N-acetylmuramoyl-L-alanine amidase [Firmicutes bacterium]|nr:N-acetylmuramoyl-L-alanine amidase [Bacillota bacterium]